ncbi:hypothetical protein RB195_004299 [Necator americanus]|uniref:Uncharacterized protein n=1 Tax=Necator americanus TaxID=51031 RepID=A0ABR1BLE8_NECAM
MDSIRSRQGSYGPTDGPRSSCPSVRLDSPSSALLSSGDFNRRTQHLAGLRSSDLKGISRLRDPAEYVSKAKHRWAGHIIRRIDDRWTKRTLEWIPRDAKRPRGRSPTRWGDMFAARMDQLRAQPDTAQGPRKRHLRSLRTSWMAMARKRNERKRCWGSHVQ